MTETIQVLSRVGRSTVGHARFGDDFSMIEIGRSAPLLRTTEDAEGLTRCGFLDPTIPIEVNVLAGDDIRAKLSRLQPTHPLRPTGLDPSKVIARRPTIGYIPAETLRSPTERAVLALAKTGEWGARVSKIRAATADGAFWADVARAKALAPWLAELLQRAGLCGAHMFAAPVPVLDKSLRNSPEVQAQVNRLVAMQWENLRGRRPIMPMYSLTIAASALQDGDMVRRALLGMNDLLENDGRNFAGIHVQFVDILGITKNSTRVDMAREVLAKVADLGTRLKIVTWGCDLGAGGPALLDLGISFTSYAPGMTPRPIYTEGGPGDPDLQYGKVLNLWSYNLLTKPDVDLRNAKLDDTGLFAPIVPTGITSARSFRVDYGKPQNVAVMEKVNNLRLAALRNGEVQAGTTHVAKSRDPAIFPWIGRSVG